MKPNEYSGVITVMGIAHQVAGDHKLTEAFKTSSCAVGKLYEGGGEGPNHGQGRPSHEEA